MTRRKIAVTLCIAVLIGVFAINGTISYLQDDDTKTNVFTVGDIDVKLEEEQWTSADEQEERYPGDIKYKNPTITAVDGDMYFRVKVELLEKGTTTAVSDEAAALIWDTIYYEATATNFIEGSAGTGSTALTLSQIKALSPAVPNYNTAAFSETPSVTPKNVKYYTYTNSTENPAVFTEGSNVVLFSTIVIPADYNNANFATMGDYDIKITVQAIQAANIETTAAAVALTAAFPLS